MRSVRPNLLWGMALALVVTGGCRSTELTNPFRGGSPAQGPLEIAVENDNYLDVTVYARNNAGARIRLGQVTGKSSATFSLPQGQLTHQTGLRLYVDPIGSYRGFLSEQVYPRSGAEVFLHVAPHLDQSYVILR